MTSVPQTDQVIAEYNVRGDARKSPDVDRDTAPPQSEMRSHKATIEFCSKAMKNERDLQRVAEIARERGLPVEMFNEMIREQTPESRKSMLLAYAKRAPSPVKEVDEMTSDAPDLVSRFVDSARQTGILSPIGDFDGDVLAAAAAAERSTPGTLDLIAARLRKTGCDPAEVEIWVSAVSRIIHGRAIHPVPMAELMLRPNPKFLIDDLIEEGSLAMFYSASGVGKTFVVLDWCYSVAAGIPWLGHATLPGAVVYVAAEGIGGLPKRISALTEHHGMEAPPPNFYGIEQAVNLLDPGHMAEAIKAVEGLGVDVRLVVFDTYARCLIGGDENAARDVGLAIAALDGLRFRLGCAVVVVHHTTKQGGDDRGSGALTGAVDTKLKLERSKGGSTLVLTVEKQKNFEAILPIMLAMKAVGEALVPVDGDAALSDPAASRWGTSSDPEGVIAERPWHSPEKVLDAFRRLSGAHAGPIIHTALVKEVGGNAATVGKRLAEMVNDKDSPLRRTKEGRSYHYVLRE